MSIKMLEEEEGVKSSKRVMGTASMITGICLLLAVGVFCFFKKELFVNAQTAITAGTTLVGIGATLLGITVFEGIIKK